MAGHSHASNVKHRKSAKDAKKSASFTKLMQKIVSKAKSDPDPDSNPALRVAIQAAQRASVPKSTIENALKNSFQTSETDLESVRYNLTMGPIAIIVEGMTDNKNRTASTIRSMSTKSGCNMTETGTIEFMFDHVGAIAYDSSICQEEDIFMEATGCGCIDFENDGKHYIIYTDKQNLHQAYEKMSKKHPPALFVELIWKAKSPIEVDDETMEKILGLIEEIEDFQDVHDVFSNIKKEYDFA